MEKKLKKVKMLKDCRVYINFELKDLKKGKVYDVNEFLFNTLTKTKRAVSLKAKEPEIEDEDIEESEDELEDEEDEIKEETQEVTDLNNMSKERLKKYCTELGITLRGNPSIETMINKINEVKNG